MRLPIRHIERQYILVYGLEGCLMPFLPVVLSRHHGLAPDQIGTVIAVGGLAVLVTPLLLTALADTDVREHILLAAALAASGICLVGVSAVAGFWPTLAAFAILSLAYEPAKPLLDGIYFATRRTDRDLAARPFHQVRVWGTVGFLVPGAVLYAVLGSGFSILTVLFAGCLLAAAGAVNAVRLPQPTGGAVAAGPRRPPGETVARMTTALRAAAVLVLHGRILAFTVAMLLLQMATAAYMAFYPLYVTDVVGLDARWLGIVANLGVTLEIGYMALFGWLLSRLGWRMFMVLGGLAQALRLLFLALFPTVAAVVATQAFHGLVVVVTLVGARVFLDEEADDRMRHAIQGLYTMLVVGGGRVAGSLAGGLLAAGGLQPLFGVFAAVCVASSVGLAWALHDRGATVRAA